MFKINGAEFNIGVKTISREAEMIEDYNVECIDGTLRRHVSGVRMIYSITLDMMLVTPEEYTALYEALTSPAEYIEMEFPYNQETISDEFCIQNVKDQLEKLINSKKYWTDLQFAAKARKLIKQEG